MKVMNYESTLTKASETKMMLEDTLKIQECMPDKDQQKRQPLLH